MFIKDFLRFVKIYGKNIKGALILLLVLATIAGALEFLGISLVFPFVMSLNKKGGNPILFGALVLGVFIFKNLYMIAFMRLQCNVMGKFSKDIYSKIMQNIILAPFSLSNTLSLEDKIAVFNHAITMAVEQFFNRFIQFITNFLIGAIIFVFLFKTFGPLAFWTVALLGIFALLEGIYFKNRSKVYGQKQLEAQKTLNASLNNIIHSIKQIKIFGKEAYFGNEFSKLSDHYSDTRMNSLALSTYPLYFTEISVLLALGFLGYFLFKGSSDIAYFISSFATFFAVILRLLPLLNRCHSSAYIVGANAAYAKWLIDIDKIFKDFPPVALKNLENIDKMPFENEIVIKDLNFCYCNEGKAVQALKNINLTIKKGEFIGIVGRSGCGKSTLFNIISGILLPEAGRVYIDGTLLTQDNVSAWQKNISLCEQDFYLSFGTIVRNVAFGFDEEDIDLEKTKNALLAAHILDEVKPDNIAQNLSFGQKHRIALARSLYFERDVLMLDEVTSSLDSVSESNISATINSLRGKKTILAIAHRLSTLDACDRIVFMKKGEIADIGTLEELASRNANFEKLMHQDS